MPYPDRADDLTTPAKNLAYAPHAVQEDLDLQLPPANRNRFDGLDVHDLLEAEQQAVVRLALSVLEHQHQPGKPLTSPEVTKDYLRLHLAERHNEVFATLFLDNRHRVISFEELFQGTIDGASVHPRVLVQRSLERNAAAVILAHNHPSGIPEPSRADIQITERLKDALALVDIRVLDHIVIGKEGTSSFTERGLL